MAFKDNRAFDIKKGEALPRFVHAFVGKKVKVSNEDFNWRRDYYVPILTAAILKPKKVSIWQELEEINEENELLALKNKGAQSVVRIHKITLA